MRRQCMRLFWNFGATQKFSLRLATPKYYFSEANSINDHKVILGQLVSAHKEKSDVKYLSDTIWQLKPFLNKFSLKELVNIVHISFAHSIQDEGYAQKVFERATELFVQKKATLTETLELLSKLLSVKYSKVHYQQQYSFIAAVSQSPDLEASQIGLAMFIYGQIVSHLSEGNKDIEQSLIIHFKLKIDKFQSDDLRNFSFGLMLAQIKNNELFELLERQSLIVQLKFSDLIRVATAIALFGKGSDQFWKMLEESALKSIPETDPKSLAVLMMFYKQCGHGNRQIYKAIEQQFIQNYDNFSTVSKLQMFSGFAKLKYPSTTVFTHFAKDISKIIQNSGVVSVSMLIFDCLSILPTMPREMQNIFFQYILNHYKDMNGIIKSKIYDSLQENNLLTEELEVALLKKH